MFPVFLNAPDVACTVTSDSASRAPYFVGCWEERKAVNFMCLAKVCKEMDRVLWQYLRTRRFAQIANAGESLSPPTPQERLGTMVNSRSAAMRSASGGCVLNSEDKVLLPNHGFTMHSAAVDGGRLVVGMRWL